MDASVRRDAREVIAYFALACAITWGLDASMDVAFVRHLPLPAHAIPLVGLGAWGPTLAAVLVARRRGVVREIFTRWRTRPTWILVGLFLPLALNLIATLTEVALGGHPAHWFYPPNRPEYVAALVMFSFGEEFGWRGFAYPRVAHWLGPVAGSVLLGAVWAAWHLGMMFTAPRGWPDPIEVALLVAFLGMWSVVFAWVFERSGRSMAVAIALHMGGHLDNANRAPTTEVRLRVLRLVVLAVVAALAARSLARRARAHNSEVTPSPYDAHASVPGSSRSSA